MACITDNNINNAISIKPILFKNNATYSCIYSNLSDTFIYQFLYNQDRKLCHSPIDCENKKYDCIPPTLTGNQNTILTLKYIHQKKEKSMSLMK